MTTKDKLMQILEESPESFLQEVLHYTLFLQAQYDTEDLTVLEKLQVAEAQKAYEAGDYITLEDYEAIQA